MLEVVYVLYLPMKESLSLPTVFYANFVACIQVLRSVHLYAMEQT